METSRTAAMLVQTTTKPPLHPNYGITMPMSEYIQTI